MRNKKEINIGLSVIIPVLNEEKYIGKLLELLTRQSFKDFEVIVVDGKSSDRTIEIVRKYSRGKGGFKLIEAPHKGVSYQRNLGAAAARSDLILFLDADVSFDVNFLKTVMEKFDSKKYDIATVAGFPEGEGNVWDYLTCILYNLYQNMTKGLKPEAYGWMMLVKRSIHEKVNGFNEELFFAEDSDYCKRIVKVGGKMEILKKTKIYYSIRRVVKEGRLSFYKKMLMYFFYSKLYGRQIAQEKIDYRVGEF